MLSVEAVFSSFTRNKQDKSPYGLNARWAWRWAWGENEEGSRKAG